MASDKLIDGFIVFVVAFGVAVIISVGFSLVADIVKNGTEIYGVIK